MKFTLIHLMFIAIVAFLIILAVSMIPANAQSSGSASSNTTSSLTSNTDARTFIDGRTLIDQSGGGTTTVRNAPQVSAPSMSSGHPCAFTPASGSISIIGAGIGAGGQNIDDACLLAQIGERDAAVQMIAARDPAACRALLRAGRISNASYCGNGGQAPKEPQTKPATAPVTAGITCSRNNKGQIMAKVARGADRSIAASYCRSKMQ